MKTPLLKNILFFLICIFIGGFNHTFSQEFSITNISKKYHLGNLPCHNIIIDTAGVVFIGISEVGLIKISGEQSLNIDQKKGLPNSFITDMSFTSQGLFLSTYNGIGNWTGQEITQYLSQSNHDFKIEAIYESKDHKLWFYATEKGLGYIQDGFINILPQGKLPDGIRVTDMKEINEKTLIVSTANAGLFELNTDQLSPYVDGNISNQKHYHSLLKYGKHILALHSTGVDFLESDNNTKKVSLEWLDQLPKTQYYSACIQENGQLWFGTELGLISIDPLSNKMKILGAENGIVGTVFTVDTDFEGGVWFGTNLGCFRLNNQYFGVFHNAHGLEGNDIQDLSIFNDKIWVSTEKGVFIQEKKGFKKVSIPYFYLNKGNGHLKQIGNQYFYINNKGIFQILDLKSFIQRKYFKSDETIQCISYSSFQKEEEVFIATNHHLYEFNGKTLENILNIEHFKDNPISCIYIAKDHTRWIGTRGGGIYVFTREGSFKHFTKDQGLPNNYINNFHEDEQGNIWVASSGNSIFKIPMGELTNGFISFDDIDLPSVNVNSIYSDKNTFWVGTNNGLGILTKVQNDLLSVQKLSGLEGFWPQRILPIPFQKDSKGRVWMGSNDGVVCIYTYNKFLASAPPKLQLDDVLLFFEHINWEVYKTEYKENQTKLPFYNEFPSSENQLTFKVEIINHFLPTQSYFQWRISELNKSWSAPNFQESVTVNDIPPGNYTFEARACNNAGFCSSSKILFTFKITKPIYKRAWFLSLLIFVFIGSLLVYFRERVRSLTNTQDLLHKRVQERTEEIEFQKSRIERQKKDLSKALKAIDEKNNQLTSINEKLTTSIMYARRIQDALIYDHKAFHRRFPESFIFHAPKSIVSSDFYLLREFEHITYFALVDCTGHGVPGAFMSFIGYEYLSQILENNPELQPGEILLELHKKLTIALNTDEDSDLNDGMDVALCKVDNKTKTLTFAGARRPLVYVKDKKLEVLKGDFSSTGITFKGVEPEFNTQSIELTAGIKIYLFSDGFANQFGGKLGKKYKTANFRNLLSHISHHDFPDQRRLLNEEFKDWMGEHEQIDDVLVIGFKYCDR